MGENVFVANMHVDYICPWCNACAPRPEGIDFFTKLRLRGEFINLQKRKPFTENLIDFTG